MTDFDTLWSMYQPMIDGLAASFGSTHRTHGAEAADFRQEAACWMLDNMTRGADLERRFVEFDDPDAFGRWLYRALENEAKDYGFDIKAQNGGGQDRQSAFWYEVGDLKTLLPSVLDPEAWLNPPQYDGEQRSQRTPAEGNNWVTTLADVSSAFSKLDADDQLMLLDFHKYDRRNKDLAQFHEVTEATMSYRHTQALKRLQKHLGGPKPKPMRADVPGDPFRGRHAVSNTRARAMTSANYDGES